MCLKKKILIGTDEVGNKYYQVGNKRMIKYHSVKEPTLIPTAWHAWLHNSIAEAPLDKKQGLEWEINRVPNLTGTTEAYYPDNYPLNRNSRVSENTYYQPWKPS